MMAVDKTKTTESAQESVFVPLEWHTPDDLVSRFANNMVVQFDGRDYFLSFFEVIPPMVIGEDAERQVKSLKSVRANCVARIIIAKDQLPLIVDALKTHLEKSRSASANSEKTEGP